MMEGFKMFNTMANRETGIYSIIERELAKDPNFGAPHRKNANSKVCEYITPRVEAWLQKLYATDYVVMRRIGMKNLIQNVAERCASMGYVRNETSALVVGEDGEGELDPAELLSLTTVPAPTPPGAARSSSSSSSSSSAAAPAAPATSSYAAADTKQKLKPRPKINPKLVPAHAKGRSMQNPNTAFKSGAKNALTVGAKVLQKLRAKAKSPAKTTVFPNVATA